MEAGSLKGKLVTVLGFALHAIVFWFYLVSGLVVPGYAVGVLILLWAGLLWLAIRWRRQPWRVFAVPFIAAVVWFVVVQGGSWLFGWTA